MGSEQHFFNQMADRWDEIRFLDVVKITELINEIGLQPGDSVLDVGCGTGVLLPFVKQAIGESGQITALDFSEQMLKRAADKYQSLKGIRYIVCDIMEFKPPGNINAIICLNFYPHVKDKVRFIGRMREILADEGCLIIMHDISRQEVNNIHKSSESVKDDRLPTAAAVVDMLSEGGYYVTKVIDDQSRYFIRAVNGK